MAATQETAPSSAPAPAASPSFTPSRIVIEPPILTATVTLDGASSFAEVPFDLRDNPGIAAAAQRLSAEVLMAGAQRMGSAQAEVLHARDVATQARGMLGALASAVAQVADPAVRDQINAAIDAVTAELSALG